MRDAAKSGNWNDFLLELSDVLYLLFNLAQEASLETVLSAALSLKHAANMKKTSGTRKEAQTRFSATTPGNPCR